ncbi:mediator of RNA polymerase II transcription subunit 6 [Erinaceus europaeus]|uniref:Mediator of RNA polymerase II transcription subunit 6 n=1 Tax=Erinaceus europaeus TaxID=9365 RepID=A0ABM3W0T7_ERIEU|nr:mediator of RNA polymerase II transcription subunit 6 [Erinaceus europaeus]
MAAVDIRDNLLGISWVDSSWIPILNSGSVLDYFSERSNPFYDRTCNNEVVKMQRLTLEHLNQMIGVEYILLHAQEPILFIIRKQQRQSPTQGLWMTPLLQKSGEKPVPVDQTKKEPEPVPETVKPEEKETAKNAQQTGTKGPPEKRMRLQ